MIILIFISYIFYDYNCKKVKSVLFKKETKDKITSKLKNIDDAEVVSEEA